MAEQIQQIIPLVRKPKSFGRSDTFTLVVTDSRMIFAELTGQMLKDAISEAQRKGKEEGKGFMARWGDQIKASMNYAQRYWKMSPDEALMENPKNFALQNQSVKKISVKAKGDDDEKTYTELKIETTSGKYQYRCDGQAKGIKEMLKGVFGPVVK